MVKKILVIEDSPTMLGMIKDTLESEGFFVVTAENGEDGVKLASQEIPDLVLIDTLLPGMDGFETCRKIHENPVTSASKLIVMTGSIDAVNALKARQSGADDYTVKTSDCESLVQSVKNVIGS